LYFSKLCIREQIDLREKLLSTSEPGFEGLIERVAGMDISFVSDSNKACVCLVIMSYPQLDVSNFIRDNIDLHLVKLSYCIPHLKW
jgi:deoxyinosine 3'endonuclease (endonuclease V)